MRLLIYEWSCSGGMQSETARTILKKMPLAGFLKEGRLMIESLAWDASKNVSIDVTVMVDETLAPEDAPQLPKDSTIQSVSCGCDIELLLEIAPHFDHIIFIAPETQGVLVHALQEIEDAGFGDRLTNCPIPFVSAASDKHTTCTILAAAGIQTPPGYPVPAGGNLPADCDLPAVLKPRMSAGCDGLRIIYRHTDFIAPETDSRLEHLASGMHGSCCCLCTSDSIIPLLPCEQLFTSESPLTYLGCKPAPRALYSRMQTLALRSIEALNNATNSRARGWVGVDMILGSHDDGRDDQVLEINPRFTTSYVGLSRGQQNGLLGPLLNHIRGNRNFIASWNEEACVFSFVPK
jgi:predicted ATP-grasp superfamily ATP-dependent carboligase